MSILRFLRRIKKIKNFCYAQNDNIKYLFNFLSRRSEICSEHESQIGTITHLPICDGFHRGLGGSSGIFCVNDGLQYLIFPRREQRQIIVFSDNFVKFFSVSATKLDSISVQSNR